MAARPLRGRLIFNSTSSPLLQSTGNTRLIVAGTAGDDKSTRWLKLPVVNTVPDKEFLRQFEDCSLPFDQWNHRAHVKVAFLYLRDHSFDQAIQKMRDGIKAYNAFHEVPESPTSGYNETTTVAFLHLVSSVMSAYGELFPTPNADIFCDRHPQLLSKHVLRLFYSPDRRSHPDAKSQFIEPDLASLPLPTCNDPPT